ncbi:MAG: RNA-guided endonuclease TnpB family protein, partial [Phascolarctobacterium sp.]
IEGRILNATVSQNPDGKYYVSICCEDVPHKALEPKNHNVGIDLGLKEFAITSDGIKYANPKYLAKSLKRLKFLQRSLSRKTKDSSNRNKARLKVARMHQKIANQRTDFLQKLSTEIIRNNDIMCLEDLQVKNMIKNHKLAQAISDVSWSEFVRMLSYKAKWYGRTIIRIDKFFQSSQRCHSCGHINPEIKDLSVREWTCQKCGAIHDRDVNAAMNILNEGLRIVGA